MNDSAKPKRSQESKRRNCEQLQNERNGDFNALTAQALLFHKDPRQMELSYLAEPPDGQPTGGNNHVDFLEQILGSVA
jgi:hypothetical protein